MVPTICFWTLNQDYVTTNTTPYFVFSITIQQEGRTELTLHRSFTGLSPECGTWLASGLVCSYTVPLF